MKTFIFSLLLILSGTLAFAQQNDIQVYEKKEGSRANVMARNIGKVSYLVTVEITSQGMDVTPGKKVEAIVPAGHIKEMASLQPRPGESWSYSYEVSFMEFTGDESNPQMNEIGETVFEPKTADVPEVNSISASTIIVYTKPGCGRCATAKKSLDSRGVKYETVDISTGSSEANQMWKGLRESGFKGETVTMPVIRVNGNYHYNISNLSQFLQEL
jgi:glutaredoxin